MTTTVSLGKVQNLQILSLRQRVDREVFALLALLSLILIWIQSTIVQLIPVDLIMAPLTIVQHMISTTLRMITAPICMITAPIRMITAPIRMAPHRIQHPAMKI